MHNNVSAEMEDSAIVDCVLDGDPSAFNNLVKKYQKQLLALVLMISDEQPAAEDLVQEAFLKAYEKLVSFDKSRPFYPWLAAIAMRVALNWFSRIKSKHRNEVGGDELAKIRSENTDVISTLDQKQRNQDLWKQVAALPSREKLAMQMFYKQELKVDEIAQIMGVTAGTVKTFLHRGRAHLKSLLAAKEQ